MIISSPMSRHRWCPRWWWWSLRRPCTSFPPGRKTGGNYEDGRHDEHWFYYIADYDGSNWYHPINHNTHYDQSELCRRPPQHPDLLRAWPNWPDWRANRWSGFRWSKVAVFGMDTAPCWYAEKKSEKTPPTLALGGTIWRFNQWLNFARKRFNSISILIQKKTVRFNSIKYSIQNYSWPIQFNEIFNLSLEFLKGIAWYSPSSWKS